MAKRWRTAKRVRVCAARFRDEEMLTRGLQSLAAEMETLEAPANVEVKLLEAFRARGYVAGAGSPAGGQLALLVGGSCGDVIDCD